MAFLKQHLILFVQIWNSKRWTFLPLRGSQPSNLVAQHQTVSQTRREIEVSYHNAVTDAVLPCMRARFSSHEKLYISCFDPNRFSEILASPQNVELSLIANAVPEIYKSGTRGQDELVSFTSSYKNLKKGLLENMNDNENDSASLESEAEYTEIAESYAKTTCKNCLSCAFKLLSEYRLCAAAYENLYAAYKLIVTLSVTQCICERYLSKQWLLKTRLRTSLTQNNLELLMLIDI